MCARLFQCNLAKFTASPELFIKWPKGRYSAPLVFCHFCPSFHNLKHISTARDPKLTAELLGFGWSAPKKKFVHACFNAIWPTLSASLKRLIKWPKGKLCVSPVFGHFCQILHNLKHISHRQGPETNCRSPWFHLECSKRKFVHACFNAIWPKFMAST